MIETTLSLVRVEDREGEGVCQACDRDWLRWVCILSDGTEVGTECAKSLLGYKPTPKSYAWVSEFVPVAEHRDGIVMGGAPAVWVLWQHKTGSATRETLNGSLQAVGGVLQAWERRGWL